MPYTITILPACRAGLAIGSGHVTGRDYRETFEALWEDERWQRDFVEVWDLTSVDVVDVTPDEVDRIVESLHARAERIRGSHVVLVSSRDAVATLARLFERLTADIGRTFHVKRTREEAADWLGVPLSALYPVPSDEDCIEVE